MTPSKKNHRYLCGLRIFPGFFVCQRVSTVEGRKVNSNQGTGTHFVSLGVKKKSSFDYSEFLFVCCILDTGKVCTISGLQVSNFFFPTMKHVLNDKNSVKCHLMTFCRICLLLFLWVNVNDIV